MFRIICHNAAEIPIRWDVCIFLLEEVSLNVLKCRVHAPKVLIETVGYLCSLGEKWFFGVFVTQLSHFFVDPRTVTEKNSTTCIHSADLQMYYLTWDEPVGNHGSCIQRCQVLDRILLNTVFHDFLILTAIPSVLMIIIFILRVVFFKTFFIKTV